MKRVEIYTDGGARGNPGPGGFGAVVIFGQHRKELKGAFDHTTNNRMELMAAIASLGILKEPCGAAPAARIPVNEVLRLRKARRRRGPKKETL